MRPTRWWHFPDAQLPSASFQAIRGLECVVTLEPRPWYCDRGNFIAKIFAVGMLARSLDHADMWPRYYFDEARAKAEVEDWLKKRKRWPDEPTDGLAFAEVGLRGEVEAHES